MQRGHREHRERRDPQRASRPGLPPRRRHERHTQRHERIGEQPHRVGGWNRPAADGSGDLQRGGEGAHRVRAERNDPPGRSADRLVAAAQHGVHDSGWQQAERAKSDRGDQRRPGDAEFREHVSRQRAQVPQQPQDRRQQQQRIGRGGVAGAAPRTNHHREQHRVERDAGAQADEVQQFAEVHGRHGTHLRRRAKSEPREWLFLANEWPLETAGGGLLLIVPYGTLTLLVPTRRRMKTSSRLSPTGSS